MVQQPGCMLKPSLEYFWVRSLQDGETIETQFNLDTGEPKDWFPVPEKLSSIGWFPIYPELAELMALWGEVGLPNNKPRIEIKLDPQKITHKVVPSSKMFWGVADRFETITEIGEKPICYLQEHLHYTDYLHCKRCNNDFQIIDTEKQMECPNCGLHRDWTARNFELEDGETNKLQCNRCNALFSIHEVPVIHVCPNCNTHDEWECRRCGAKNIKEYYCNDCGNAWHRDEEFKDYAEIKCPSCQSEKVTPVGELKTRPKRIHLEMGEVRCVDCAAEGRVYGLNKIINLEPRVLCWLETKYVIGKEDGMQLVIAEDEIKGF